MLIVSDTIRSINRHQLQSSSTISPPPPPPAVSNNMRGTQGFERKMEEMKPSKRYACSLSSRKRVLESVRGSSAAMMIETRWESL